MELAETLEKMIALQAADSGLDELERVKKHAFQEIESSAQLLSSERQALLNEKKALEELSKERKAFELEVATQENRIRKYQQQEAEVRNEEQFTALKAELEKSRVERTQAEEKALGLLFQEDEQKAKIGSLTGQFEESEKRAAGRKKEMEERIADCDKAAQDKTIERAQRAALVPMEQLQGYEALRRSGKKVAVARVQEDGTCSGCHLNVPPQVVNALKQGRTLERCNCGRFLYLA